MMSRTGGAGPIVRRVRAARQSRERILRSDHRTRQPIPKIRAGGDKKVLLGLSKRLFVYRLKMEYSSHSDQHGSYGYQHVPTPVWIHNDALRMTFHHERSSC